MSILNCLLFLLCMSTVHCRIVHISIVFRHGHRSPLWAFGNSTAQWPDGLGQLTNIGKRNHLLLGQFLRNQYSNAIGQLYNASWHHVRSSDIDRTLMSASVCMAGLFPPTGRQVWTPQLAWQPVPIHTVPATMDAEFFPNKLGCPRLRQLAEMSHQLPKYRRECRQMSANISRIARQLGWAQLRCRHAFRLTDTMMVMDHANLSLPLTPDDRRLLRRIGRLSWQQYTWNEEITKLRIGMLLRTILHKIAEVARSGGSPVVGQRLSVYSGHDTTLLPLLVALGNRDFVWPNFAAALIFELHSVGEANFVRIFYRNDTTQAPIQILLPECGPNCPLDRLQQLTQKFQLDNQQFLADCAVQAGNNFDDKLQGKTPANQSSVIISYTFCAVVGVLIVLVAIATIYYHYRRRIANSRYSADYHSISSASSR